MLDLILSLQLLKTDTDYKILGVGGGGWGGLNRFYGNSTSLSASVMAQYI